MSLIPPTAAAAGLGYTFYLAFCPEARPKPKPGHVNASIRKTEAKVADFVDVEDIAEKAAFCRCWKSKNVTVSPIISIALRNKLTVFYDYFPVALL